MIAIINSLEPTTSSPIGNIGDFVHPTHQAGKKMYPLGSRSILLGKQESPLAEVTEQGIKIGNTLFPIEQKIDDIDHMIHYGLSTVLGYGVMMPEQRKLSKDISLNHFGACFKVEDIDTAVHDYIEATKKTCHSIYEDPAGREENMRWLFVGNAESDDPMFEIVLPDPGLEMRPHFQIDIDTDCSQDEIETFFSSDFFDWKLDIPGVGTVLQMGTLWNIYGYDIRLGVGNNKRSKQEHRKSMVQLA